MQETSAKRRLGAYYVKKYFVNTDGLGYYPVVTRRPSSTGVRGFSFGGATGRYGDYGNSGCFDGGSHFPRCIRRILSSSGNQLVDVFAMARQNSISKNDFTAIVILTSGTTACSAYCLMELPRQADLNSDGTVPTPTLDGIDQLEVPPDGSRFRLQRCNRRQRYFHDNFDNGATTPPMLPTPLPATINFQGTQIQPPGLRSGCAVLPT